MSASASRLDGPGAKTRQPPGRRRCLPGLAHHEFTLVAASYLLAAIAVTALLWKDPASRIVAGNPGDPDQSAWWMRYAADAIAHWHLPALITSGMNAPTGVAVMWNPSLLAPGVVLAPVTLLFGPQVSLNVLLTVGFAGSATSLYWVLRRWSVGVVAAVAGGLAYGFSPALTQSAIGHYDLQFAVFPPLIAYFAARLVTGRPVAQEADRSRAGPLRAGPLRAGPLRAGPLRAGPLRAGALRSGPLRAGALRSGPLRAGAGLGLTAALQLLTCEELLFNTVVAVGVGLLVAGVSGARRVRSLSAGFPAAAAREQALRMASGLLMAAGVFVMLAGYPLWTQLAGPLTQHGSPYLIDYYKNDLYGFVEPSRLQLVHTARSAAFAGQFAGGLAEYLGYLGWPMMVVLAWAAGALWRVLAVRALTVAFLVLEVFSLGGTLLADGHVHGWFKLPWYWLQGLPLASSAVVDRFSIVADGCAAALLAVAVDAAWRALSEGPAVTARRRLLARLAIGAAICVTVIPMLPAPLPTSTVAGVPAGWTQVLTALRVPGGGGVLTVPVATGSFTTPMRWQADTGLPTDMAAGYFIGPVAGGQAYIGGYGPSATESYLDYLWLESGWLGYGVGSIDGAGVTASAKAPTRQEAAAWISQSGLTDVVAVTSTFSPLARYLTSLLGPPATQSGDVVGWRVPR